MTRDEWDALTPAAKCDLLEQRIAGDFFSESERDIVRDVVALARQNAHERDSAVERERLQRECVVCHADLEPDRVLVPHCNDCVVTDEHEWEWHDRLTQLNALGADDAPDPRRRDGRAAVAGDAVNEDPAWWLTRDGDVACLQLYARHYSAYRYRDGRVRKLFVGPGEKVVLRTLSGDAFFVWRKFRDDSGQVGINCAAFRNEGTRRSSDLIRQADAIADCLWPGERHYTYVNAARVKSANPGFCFLAAGWRRCGRTKGGLHVLERTEVQPPTTELRAALTEARRVLREVLKAHSNMGVTVDWLHAQIAAVLAQEEK